MTELSRLISCIRRGIMRKESYINTIRYPHLLVSSLQELNDLIGNEKVKDAVATQVTHLIMIKRRSMEDPTIKEDEVMLNTVLYGPPGVGKTLIGTKLAKIWYSLGYLDGSNNPKEKKQDFNEVIKNFLKDKAGGSNTNIDKDVSMFIYVLFIFIIIFISFLSMTWSFYNKFGSTWTIIALVVIIIIIIAVGYYISSLFNKNSEIKNTKRNSKFRPINVRKTETTFDEPHPSDDNIIKVVTRADFVDRYVGWTDKKTIKLLEENLGKVVFVDEAYSLVTDVHDTFGMEALNAINLFLSQHPREIIVIFAGYKDLMEAGIFSFQPGLKRRFMWQFYCNGYTPDQLFDIFKMQLRKKGWGLVDEEIVKKIFQQNADAFPSYGGDTERLTFFSELEHSRDFIRGEKNIPINKLLPEHVRKGLVKLRENNIHDDSNDQSSNLSNPIVGMMKILSKVPLSKENFKITNALERNYH